MNLSPLRRRILVVALLTVSFLGALDHTIVATSLATIAAEVGGVAQMSWVIVSYTLAGTVLLPVMGKVADVLGARVVFIGSLVLFIVASAFCGFAQDIVQLTVARVAQGVGSAGLTLMPQTIVGVVVAARQRPQILSVIGASFPIAILVGPLLGGVITESWGWRWVFWINVPVGLIALGLALPAIPRIARVVRGSFDVRGAVVMTVWVSALVLAVGWVGAGDVPGAVVLAGFAVAAAGFVLFIVIELRAPEPLVPLRHFADRTIVLCIVLTTVIGVGLFSVVSYVPTYIQMAYRTSATVSGVVPIATVFGMLVATLATGWLASRTGRYRLYPVIGTAVAAVGLFAMAALPAGVPLWVPTAAMTAVGLGTGAFSNIVIAAAQAAAPAGDIGSVTATVNLVRQIGSSAATAVVGGIIGAGVLAGLPATLDALVLTPETLAGASDAAQQQVSQLYVDVMSPIFLGLAAVYCIGFAAALLLPDRRLEDEPGGRSGDDASTVAV